MVPQCLHDMQVLQLLHRLWPRVLQRGTTTERTWRVSKGGGREGRESRERIIDPMAIGGTRVEGRGEGARSCSSFCLRILRLPADKLQRLISALQEWGDRKVCIWRELESLIGLLNHACKVVYPGHTFLRRMIDLLSVTGRTGSHHSHHHICLNREFTADLAW